MVEIKNVSKEAIEIITRIDTTIPGCRVLDTVVEPQRLEPNQVLSILGYEPGVLFILRPVEGPETPRSSLT
jgi:hypothetical protein